MKGNAEVSGSGAVWQGEPGKGWGGRRVSGGGLWSDGEVFRQEVREDRPRDFKRRVRGVRAVSGQEGGRRVLRLDR